MTVPQLGNVYRGVKLKNNFGISYTDYITSFASFFWIDTSLNLIIATAIIFLLTPQLQIGRFRAWVLLSAITSGILILPILAQIILNFIKVKSQKLLWLKTKLTEVIHTTLENLKDVVYISKIVALGVLALIRTVILYYLLFIAFEVQPSISVLVVFYALFKLSLFIIITPGNIGIQEIAYGFISEHMGIGMAQGILVCLVVRVIGTTLVIILGVMAGSVSLLRNKKDYKSISPD